ncbi:MAG: hypothetical protein DMG24_04000 [Acidobacteria bacterium]|nr:MAG: hypothetical protein DMG24_04000 [Acidobacteriota bacterium]
MALDAWASSTGIEALFDLDLEERRMRVLKEGVSAVDGVQNVKARRPDKPRRIGRNYMQKAMWLVSLVLFFSLTAMAQETPKAEVFLGYSHLLANLNNTSFNMNGAHVSVAENLNDWFGGVLEFSTHYGTENGFKVNTQSIMYGPTFSYRKKSPITPSAHVVLGVQKGSGGLFGISRSSARFGMGLGGAVDVKVSDMVSIRIIQADYLLTRFLGTRQDNIRASAGIVLTFGKK